MQPFIIICETCQSRLKVASAASIGQILACPKCHSMVHIQGPGDGGQETEGEGTGEQETGGREQGAEHQDGHTVDKPRSGVPGDAIPDETAGRHSPLLLATGAVVGLFLGGMVAVWWFGSENVKQASGDREQVAEERGQGTGEKELVAGVSRPEQVLAVPTPRAPNRLALPEQRELIPVDPLDMTQESDDTSIQDITTQPDLPLHLTTPEPETDENLSQNAPSTPAAPSSRSALPATGIGSKQPTTATTANVRLAPPDPNTNAPNAEAALAMQVSRYRAHSIPLAAFLDEIGALAGVPVNLDPTALASVGATTQTPVSIDIEEATLADILIVALGKLRLQHAIEPTYIAVKVVADVKQLETPPTMTLLDNALNRPVTFTFSQWTTLETLRREWQRILGLTILIDWPALADRGLHPTSRIQCSVVNRTLSEAVTATLDPLGLTWRAIEETAIQITVGQ